MRGGPNAPVPARQMPQEASPGRPATSGQAQAPRATLCGPEARACAAVAVVLCLQELDRAKALECLPTPAALLAQLRARAADFDLLAGVAAAYLHERGIATVHEVR